MWCERCQIDVAAQTSRDAARLYCTRCGSELPVPAPATTITPVAGAAVRDPRELLARWASEEAHDPFGPLLGIGSERTARSAEGRPDADPTTLPPASSPRFDRPHTAAAPRNLGEPPRQPDPAGAAAPHTARPSRAPAEHRLHHRPEVDSAPWAPRSASPRGTDRSARWVALAGQICAYLGVGTLTIGAVLVIVGQFGGQPAFAPYGWLVTTAGQLLLFLGVVTLISSGLEQTAHEVARTIERLEGKLEWLSHGAYFEGEPPQAPPAEPTSATTERDLRDEVARLQAALRQRV